MSNPQHPRSLQIYLSAPTHDRLKAIAARSRGAVPMSVWVREAVQQRLVRDARARKR